ncbi:MAG TPA: RNA methyltransferase [Longimicrobiales bacterium]|nr:RNA methyltransferase [Longimicrobiales bacterium]
MTLSETRRRLVGRLHRRRTREREGLVLVEGVRAVEEALAQGARPRFVLVSPRGRELATPDLRWALDAIPDVQEVTEPEMAAVAGTDAPQGIVLVAEEPRPDPAGVWGDPSARILVLDGVQDPGNVGTLVRAAAAFACSAVVVLDGTAEVWSAKALRAAAGTAFRIPVLHQPWDEAAPALDASGLPLLRADAGGTPVDRAPAHRAWALALGGEGGGCRPEVAARATTTLAIPMPGGVESLNVGVAGAILLHELTREARR